MVLNAVSFGTEVVAPSEVMTSLVYTLKNSPTITGPMAPPLIPIVLKVAETTEVDSRAVKYMITFAERVTKFHQLQKVQVSLLPLFQSSDTSKVQQFLS
jgi:hypothetical protein